MKGVTGWRCVRGRVYAVVGAGVGLVDDQHRAVLTSAGNAGDVATPVRHHIGPATRQAVMLFAAR
jgi:hypothetical protein